MKKFLIFLIKKYQQNLSPLNRGSCRFTPTCSEYAIQALQTRGLFIGLTLSILRILRCNPLFKGGYDPVPQRRKEK